MNLFFSSSNLVILLMALFCHWCLFKTYRSRFLSLYVFSLIALCGKNVLALGLALCLPYALLALANVRVSLFRLWFSIGLLVGIWASLRLGFWVKPDLYFAIGISFLTFRALQYVADRYRGVIKEKSPLKLGIFLLFAPSFPCGPLASYQDFFSAMNLTWSKDLAETGLRRVLLGYFKKAVLIDFVFVLAFAGFFDSFVSRPSEWTLSYSLGAICFVWLQFFKAYLDLSAYSDLAIGFSRLFGVVLPENFLNPFAAASLGDFWRRYHATLSRWCRNQVYFPVYGAFRRGWLGAMATMMVMALWHAISFSWAIWGLYHAAGLVISARLSRRVQNLPVFVGRLLTLTYVAFGYSFVAVPNFCKAVEIFSACVRLPLLVLR